MGITTMNKKGLEFKSFFFSIIAVSMLLTALGTYIIYTNSTYNADIDYDFSGFQKLDELSANAQAQQASISPDNANPGTDFESTTFTGAFGVVKGMYNSFSLVFGSGGLIDAAGEKLGLPDYIKVGIITMILIAITMAIVAIVFRLSRSSA